MTGLCGWFGGAAQPEGLAAMLAELSRFHAAPVHRAEASFGAVASSATRQAADAARREDVLAAVWGQPSFDDAELSGLASDRGSAHALAQGWLNRRTELFPLLRGSFAVAVLDGAGEAALAVDRLGTRPLCYAALEGQIVFASSLDAINAYPRMSRELDPQALYDYLFFHAVPGPRTVYRDRRRIEAGHYLHWKGGAARCNRYWKMRFVEDERRPFGELKEHFLHTLRESVRDAARHGAVGSFLSGGTDSSTIAGILGEVTGVPARTYSIGFHAEGYDEMEYARIAARHFHTDHHEYYVTPDDVVAAIPQIAAVHDQPFGNASAVPTFYCARLARQNGIETLLGGDGGDELFGGNTRYAHQHLLSLYSDLPSALRNGFIEPVAFALPGISLIGKAQRYIRYASKPMPARYDEYNLLERLGAAKVFTPEFLEQVDITLPSRETAGVYAEADAGSLINRMLAFDFKYTLTDNDLPKVARSCELAGVEARFPLLDDAVVDFSARLAPSQKLKGTELRHFFKQALADFLPHAILTKSKHGFGLPFGVWLERHEPLRRFALDSLAGLGARRVVRPALMDELVSARVAEHAAYFGTMVWLLVVLEQWLAERKLAL